MKFTTKLAGLFLAGAVLAPQANAAVGASGCGLGSVIMPSNSMVSQFMALTTNSYTGTQFFGITSGTSNCSTSGLVMNDKEQMYFAETNFENIKAEMAQGKGENLNAFAQILGCSDTQSFSQSTQKNYSKIIPSAQTTSHEMLEGVKALNLCGQNS